MSEPVETFLGWTGLGFGVLLAYGAYKNVPILGPTGLLTTSLTTGKVPTVPGKGQIGPGKAPRKATGGWGDYRPGGAKYVPGLKGILEGRNAWLHDIFAGPPPKSPGLGVPGITYPSIDGTVNPGLD